MLDFTPHTISLGRIQTMGRSRFFTVAAGVGVHAELLYRANARAKQRGGYLAYYTQGVRLLFRHPFVPFPVEITTSEGEVIETTALELVAMRVRSFGGPLRHWRPGSSLLSPDLRLVLLRNASRAHILRYTLQALTGIAPYDELDTPNADFSFVFAKAVTLPFSRRARLRASGAGRWRTAGTDACPDLDCSPGVEAADSGRGMAFGTGGAAQLTRAGRSGNAATDAASGRGRGSPAAGSLALPNSLPDCASL